MKHREGRTKLLITTKEVYFMMNPFFVCKIVKAWTSVIENIFFVLLCTLKKAVIVWKFNMFSILSLFTFPYLYLCRAWLSEKCKVLN